MFLLVKARIQEMGIHLHLLLFLGFPLYVKLYRTKPSFQFRLKVKKIMKNCTFSVLHIFYFWDICVLNFA